MSQITSLFPIYRKMKELEFGKGLFDRLLLLTDSLWLFARGLWSLAGDLRSFVVVLVVCGRCLF